MNRQHFILRACVAVVVGLSGGFVANDALSQAAASASGATILVLGDSLSAEYGLKRGEGWVALLEKRLAEQNMAARVVNASVSGETTSGDAAGWRRC